MNAHLSVTWWPNRGYRAEFGTSTWVCEHQHKTPEAAHACARRYLTRQEANQ